MQRLRDAEIEAKANGTDLSATGSGLPEGDQADQGGEGDARSPSIVHAVSGLTALNPSSVDAKPENPSAINASRSRSESVVPKTASIA